MATRIPGGDTIDPSVNEAGDEDESPVADATPVDVSATVVNGSDPRMNEAGEVDANRPDDGESRPEDAVNESA